MPYQNFRPRRGRATVAYGGPAGIVQRFLTNFMSSAQAHLVLSSPVNVTRVVMDVYPFTTANTGLPTGAPVLVANLLQTIDFAHSGNIEYIVRNGSDYFNGFAANVRLYNGANEIVKSPVNEDLTQTKVVRNEAAVLGSDVGGDVSLPAGWTDNGDGSYSWSSSVNSSSFQIGQGLVNGGAAGLLKFTVTNYAGSGSFGVSSSSSDDFNRTRVSGNAQVEAVIGIRAGQDSVRLFARATHTLTVSDIHFEEIPAATPYWTAMNVGSGDSKNYVFNGSVSPNTWTAGDGTVLAIAGT